MDAIRTQLAADHRVFDHLFQRLLHALCMPTESNLQAAWCELEHRLLSHMDVEEQLLLPLLGRHDSAAAQQIRTEHARIRGLVDELSAAVELRALGEPALRKLIEALSEHAETEEPLLYRLAGAASPALQCRLATALRASARCAHEAASKTLANR